jgi:dihydrofolate reductase
MAKLIFGMTMSLDGYVEGPDGSTDGLYPDLAELRPTAYMNEMIAETGAVLMGRRSFEMAEDPDWYVGNYEFQCPVVVVTHAPPATMPRQDDRLTFAFVDDVEAAVTRAKEAAGDRAVTAIGGADLGRQLLALGLVDELRVDVMPVLLGGGTPLFDGVAPARLTKLAVGEVGPRTTLRFGFAA